MTQATLGASQAGIGFKRERDIAAPAHLGALIAAKPRIHGLIRGAVLAVSLSSSWRRVCLRSSKPPLPHTSVHLTMTSKRQHGCSSRKPHRQRTSLGNAQQGPRVAGPTVASLGHPGSASQDDDSDDMDFSMPRKSHPVGRSTKRSSHDSLIGHASDA